MLKDVEWLACINNIFVRIVVNLAGISKFSTSVCLIVLGVIMRFLLFSYRFPSLILINLDISNCLWDYSYSTQKLPKDKAVI